LKASLYAYIVHEIDTMQTSAYAAERAPLLSVTNLRYRYSAQFVLDRMSFDLRAGEIVALVGRNGAGKSTLLRCIAGWTRPTEGEIRLSGVPFDRIEREARRKVALVPDTPPFYDDLTAWEHLHFIAQANRLANWQKRAEQLLRRFGLTSARNALPLTFSRGMRYKLALSLALLIEPQLLLLDEPFGPLDPVSAEELWDMLAAASEQQTGILLSSHQLPPSADPDRYLIMEAGALITEGTPEELHATLSLNGNQSLEHILRAALSTQQDDDVA
jgi:ABC-2 type transport system ATP-binding protein